MSWRQIGKSMSRRPYKKHVANINVSDVDDVEYVIVLTDGSTYAVIAKTPHMGIALFALQEPELADQIASIGQTAEAQVGYRGVCRRCSRVILDRDDERPVPAPEGGGMHCGECGVNARLNLNRSGAPAGRGNGAVE